MSTWEERMTEVMAARIDLPDRQLQKGQSCWYSELWASLDQTLAQVVADRQPRAAGSLACPAGGREGLSNPHAWDARFARPLPDEPEEEFWSPEPVMAWRRWRWTGTALRGVVVEWPSSELVALCDECEEVPGWSHTCGIYGFPTPELLGRQPSRGMRVYGCVELTGMVIEHDLGYRASHARIIGLIIGSQDLAQQIRTTYPDVTVHVTDLRPEGQRWRA